MFYLFSEAMYCMSYCLASFIDRWSLMWQAVMTRLAMFLLCLSHQGRYALSMILEPIEKRRVSPLGFARVPAVIGYICILMNHLHSTWSGRRWTPLTSEARVNSSKLLIPEPQFPHLYNELNLFLKLLPIKYDRLIF